MSDSEPNTYTLEKMVAGLSVRLADVERRLAVLERPAVSASTQLRPEDYDRALALGTAMHRAMDLFDLGVLNLKTVDPELLPYVEAWARIRKEQPLGSFTLNLGALDWTTEVSEQTHAQMAARAFRKEHTEEGEA